MEIKMIKEQIKQPLSNVGFGFGFREPTPYKIKGEVFITLDGVEQKFNNVYTLDGSILASMLFSKFTGASGISMLAIGTGATGTQQVPSIADQRQRALNTELYRKAFSSIVFRKSDGTVSTIPTNVVDFTTVFSEGEATGSLNEMGLLSPKSLDPSITTPNPALFPTYDTTVNVSQYDILINYLTFPVINKPAQSVLAITWRLTF